MTDNFFSYDQINRRQFGHRLATATAAGAWLTQAGVSQSKPEQLAEAFEDFGDLEYIAKVLLEALSKTRWSPRVTLQETATAQEIAKPN